MLPGDKLWAKFCLHLLESVGVLIIFNAITDLLCLKESKKFPPPPRICVYMHTYAGMYTLLYVLSI